LTQPGPLAALPDQLSGDTFLAHGAMLADPHTS
jgi:hypothetical protein